MLRDIRDILGADYYKIPRFQRPYSWNVENLDEFWRDVIHDNDPGYFIGPMVSYAEKASEFGIVDGQQRLTTVSLILAALRDAMSTLGDKSLARGIAKYLERPDDDDHVHYVLRSLASEKYLSSQILATPPRQENKAVTGEERLLAKAFRDIKERLEEEVAALTDEVPDGEDHSPRANMLRNIRDRILSLQVIWIKLDNQDDAYVVFETLNSRGKDLEVVDLLKNHLLNHVRNENADLDNARSNWEEMRRVLEEQGQGVNPNKFILHWWLSRHDYTAERKLFRLIKNTVKKPEAPALISDLKYNSRLYARISNPDSWDLQPSMSAARDALKALNTFGVSQPRPILLALLRGYDRQEIKFATLRKNLELIERYHFVTTVIVGISSTGGISEMYAKHAREFSSANDDASRNATLEVLRSKLSNPARLPSKETFLAEFPRVLRFSEVETSQKRTVQYVLRKMQDYERPHAAVDHAKCNIEHLSAQSHAEKWMPSIGNLFWIDGGLNNKLGNKSFAEKKAILKQHDQMYSVDDIVAADEWTEKEASRRGARLAELAWNSVWKL